VFLLRQHIYPALSGVPLRVEVMFGLTKKNFAKSDVDNLLKPFFDGLQDAGVIANDRYVYEVEAKKVLSTESFILFSVMKL
jgi:Holliday junction resolvase RusA-like endonuclease